jgi:hypothetical protein
LRTVSALSAVQLSALAQVLNYRAYTLAFDANKQKDR